MSKIDKFIPSSPLNTAVLFLVFNRLDTTKQVFEAIREAKPPRLYIAADGARENKEGEDKKAQAVRDYIMSNIDWKCEVKTLFREQNFGCKMAVSGAIDWFFENEEMGIILEDDCLPSQSFFWFCEQLLEKYKDDIRVGMISGSNFQDNIKRGNDDYYFSTYGHIWGWATWRRSWANYNVNLMHIVSDSFLEKYFVDSYCLKKWKNIFKSIKLNKIDTWDYQWNFTLWYKNCINIIPNVNLIKNIGFGVDATHTTDADNILSNLHNYDLVISHHPARITVQKDADNYITKKRCVKKSFFEKLINKIIRVLS